MMQNDNLGVVKGLEDAEKPKQLGVAYWKFQLTRNNKALSPIFATLIILAVVTVLFIPVFIWATGVTSQNQESWGLAGTNAQERIVVEEVNLKYYQTNCTIYVRNIGKTTVTINNVLITAPNGDVFTYEKTKNELATKFPGTENNHPNSIIQGDLIEIRITNLKGLPTSVLANRDKLFTIKVFTTRGVGGEYQI